MRQPSLQINQQLRVAQSSQETDHILGALMLSWTACCFLARGRCELLQCDVDEGGLRLRWSSRDRRVFISKFNDPEESFSEFRGRGAKPF